MHRKQTFAMIVLVVATAGCALVAGAYATAAVSYGVSQIDENGGWRDYEYPVNVVWKAVLEELNKRGIRKTEKDIRYNKQGIGTLKQGDGELQVFEHPKYKQFTRVYVRIGVFATNKKYKVIKEFLDALSNRADAYEIAQEKAAKQTNRS